MKRIPEIFKRIPRVSFSKSWAEVHTWNCLHFGCVYNRKSIVKSRFSKSLFRSSFETCCRFGAQPGGIETCHTGPHHGTIVSRHTSDFQQLNTKKWVNHSVKWIRISSNPGKWLSRLLSGQTVISDTQGPALTGRTVQTKTLEVINPGRPSNCDFPL